MKRNTAYRRREWGVRNSGFTLIELAVSIVVLGLIALLIVSLFPGLSDRMRLDRTEVNLDDVNDAIVGFSFANNRLPCPDTNNDGFEGGAGGCDANDEVGTLPFRDMGLPGPALDEARRPLRYGVYRNAAFEADLATLTELFEPALPDALDITSGTVLGCNEVLDPPQTIIIYDLPPATTLRVNVESGVFQDEEFVGFVRLELANIAADPPPAPFNPPPLVFQEAIYCPCGSTPFAPFSFSCLTCPASFSAGKFSLLLEKHLLTSDTSSDVPLAIIKDIIGSTLYGFPGGGIEAGDTVHELYNPAELFLIPQPTRQVTDPATDDPDTDEFDPTGTGPTENLLSGVTAEVTSAETKLAYVVENGVTVVGPGVVDLGIEIPRLNPPPPFSPGDRVYGASSGAVGTVVSQVTVNMEFDDVTPESVVGSGGGTATILAGSDTGSFFIVDGIISGSISGFDDQGNPGDTITGVLSDTQADVIKVISSNSSIPVVSRGAISFTPTLSGQTNELDFCQGLRNAIVAAGDTGSSDFLHTVNAQAIAVNPAWILVSGGVEDADGNGLDGSFDQRNEITEPLDFESPARLRNDSSIPGAVYDDIVTVEPMNVLAYRLACARNIGAVNALAVDATVMRNIAELAFNGNEQALAMIDLSFRGRELAQLNLELIAAQLALNAAGLAITIYQAIADFEGLASIAAISLQIAALAGAIANLVVADDAFDSAQETYAASCVNQQATAAALAEAIMAAEEALDLARRADAWGGVK